METDVSLNAYLVNNIFPITINESEKFKIQFGKELSKNTKVKQDIFDKGESVKPEKLKEYTTSNGIRIYNNFPLPRTTSVMEFKFVIGFLFNARIGDIKIIHGTRSDENSFESNDVNLNIVNLNETLANIISIGENNYEIIINKVTQDELNYQDNFLENYSVTTSFLAGLIDKNEKQLLDIIIKNISYRSFPVKPISNISLPKIFNGLHINGIWKKIIIHDDLIDGYYKNQFPVQYIKADSDNKYPFKGTKTTFNTVTIYVNKQIANGISLVKLDITKTGNIVHTYSIMDTSLVYEEITKKIEKYIKTKFQEDIIDKLYISNAILESDEIVYGYEINDINSVTTVHLEKKSKFKIDSLSEILQQNIPEMRYNSKTSFSLSGYNTITDSIVKWFTDITITHTAIGESSLKKIMLPNIICSNYIDDTISVSIEHSSNIETAILNSLLIIRQIPVDGKNIGKNNELTVENITKRCISIPTKSLLKILEDIDNKTFGVRYVKGKIRPYSGLAQKDFQRVVPISEEEYEIVKREKPLSVANIENQTNGSRLCLYCPYEIAPFINFHYSPGELCVPKCTFKQSNKQQYNICAEQLNILDKAEFDKNYSNQTIVTYNPLIAVGRKCFVPDEFTTLLSGYLLIKVQSDDIVSYMLENYNIQPFIIQRNSFRQNYTIYTEYNPELDYALVFKGDSDITNLANGITDTINYMYLITIFDDDIKKNNSGKILRFSENSYVRNFFKNLSAKSSRNKHNLFNYISRILKANLTEYYDLTTDAILKSIAKKFSIKYVYLDDYIIGIMHKSKFFSTPNLFIKYIEKTNDFVNAIELVGENGSDFEKYLPEISNYNIEFINRLYKDYSTKTFRAIEFDGIINFIKPTPNEIVSKQIILYDGDSYLMEYLMNILSRKKVLSKEIMEYENVNQIITNWFIVFVNSNKKINSLSERASRVSENVGDISTSFDDNSSVKNFLEEFKSFLRQHNIISDKRNVAWNNDFNILLWRNSKITPKDFNNFSDVILSGNDSVSGILNYMNNSMYKRFIEELSFQINDIVEKISSKKITF